MRWSQLSLIAAIATYLIAHRFNADRIRQRPRPLVSDRRRLAAACRPLAALVIGRLVQVWMARRSGSAGARLHGRLVTIFSLIAVIPVVLTATAAGITTQLGMDAWFNERREEGRSTTRSAVAESYLEEHKNVIRADICFAMAQDFRISFGRSVAERSAALSAPSSNAKQAARCSHRGAGIYDARRSTDRRSSVHGRLHRRTHARMERCAQPRRRRASRPMSRLASSAPSSSSTPSIELYLVTVRSVNEKVLAYQQDTQDVVARYTELGTEPRQRPGHLRPDVRPHRFRHPVRRHLDRPRHREPHCHADRPPDRCRGTHIRRRPRGARHARLRRRRTGLARQGLQPHDRAAAKPAQRTRRIPPPGRTAPPFHRSRAFRRLAPASSAWTDRAAPTSSTVRL